MILAMISPVDMVVVVGVALVVFGPKRLPEVARQLGSFVREARSMMSQVTDSFEGINHDVRSTGFSGDNVMKPRAQSSQPTLVPYDQREANTPPILPGSAERHEAGVTTGESAPTLKLTDVSVAAEDFSHPQKAEAAGMETGRSHEQRLVGDAAAVPHEANKL